MAFSVKNWINGVTQLNDLALEDMETRLSAYIDSLTATSLTAGEKQALAGTSGVPSVTNKFVTDADARNTNIRTAAPHAAAHAPAGGDPLGALSIDATQIAANAISTSKILDANITTAKILDAAVTAAKIEAQQAWQTLAAAAPISANIFYMKDSLGFVHFRGDGYVATAYTTPNTIFTMPAGYRPGVTIYWSFGTVTYNMTTGGVVSNSLTTGGGGNAGSAISQLTYKAEN